jgi:CRP-like cAMP-binding protein
MEIEKVVAHLGLVDLFRKIDPEDLNRIIGDSYITTYQSGEMLFCQDDPAEVFFVLLEGRIKLSQMTLKGIR